MKLVFLFAIFSLGSLSTPAAANRDVFAKYGFSSSPLQRDVAEEAIELANKALSLSSLWTLVPHWETSSQTAISIFWVGSKNLSFSRDDMMFVLRECTCIVVQPLVFNHWINQLSSNRLDLSLPHVLAYFLLHEVGHIASGHEGRALAETTKRFNLVDTASKIRERQADSFAAQTIKLAQEDESDFMRALDIQWVTIALQNLSFNLTGIRLLDEFGGTSLALPKLFQDDGASHPNFELRVLTVLNEISQTPESRALLDDFLRLQSDSETRDRVLFQAQPDEKLEIKSDQAPYETTDNDGD